MFSLRGFPLFESTGSSSLFLECGSMSFFVRSEQLPGVDFKSVREQVSMAAVCELVGFISRESHGSQSRGPCPIHGSKSTTSRSFSVNLDKKAYRCFTCGASGNQLDLWAAVNKLDLLTAAIGLCAKLQIDVPWRRSP
jgi:DNA primase